MKPLQIMFARGIAATGLLFLNYVVSNGWSSETLGRVSTVLSLVIGCGVLSRFGLDILAIRKVGTAHHLNDSYAAKSYFWAAFFLVILSSALLVVLVWVFGDVLLKAFPIGKQDLVAAMSLIFPVGVSVLVASSLRGYGSPALGQVLEIGGFALIMASLAVLPVFSRHGTDGLYSVYRISSFFYASILILCSVYGFGLPKWGLLRAGWCDLISEKWKAFTLYLFALMQFATQWAGVLIAASLLSAVDAAVIAVAQRFSMVIFLFLGTVGGVMAPKYAGLHAAGKYAEVISSERRIRRLLVLCVLPVAGGVFMFPDFLLQPFGVGRESGVFVLRALVLGQLLNVCTGCAAHMLAAFGRELSMLKIGLAGAFVSLVGSGVGGALYGVEGLAVGQALGVAVPALLSFFLIRRLLARGSERTA